MKKKNRNVIRTPKLFMKWKGWIDSRRYGKKGCLIYLESIENRLLSRYAEIISELEATTFNDRNQIPEELTEYERLVNPTHEIDSNTRPENISRAHTRNKEHKERLEVIMGRQHASIIHETLNAQIKMDDIYRPANEKVKAYLLGACKNIPDLEEYDLPKGSDMLELEKKTWAYLDDQISVFGHKRDKGGEKVC